MQLQGVIHGVPADNVLAGEAVVLNVGGVATAWVLDAKGRSRSEKGTFQLRAKWTRDRATGARKFSGGDVPFRAKVRGYIANEWRDEGMSTDQTGNFTLRMGVGLNWSGTPYATTLSLTQKTIPDKAAKLKN